MSGRGGGEERGGGGGEFGDGGGGREGGASEAVGFLFGSGPNSPHTVAFAGMMAPGLATAGLKAGCMASVLPANATPPGYTKLF